MSKKSFKTALALLMSAVMTVSAGNAVFAEKYEAESSETEFFPKPKNANNGAIIGKVIDALDPDGGYVVNLEYDEQQRIIAAIVKKDNEKWISTVTYGENYTYTQSELEPYYGEDDNAAAEEEDEAFPKKKNANNGAIIGRVIDALDPDGGYAVSLEYDEQQRIIAAIVKKGDEKWISTVTYGENYTYTQSALMPYSGEEEGVDFNELAMLAASSVNYDEKMSDSAVLSRIENAQRVWNELPDMRNLAHIDADVARADYCAVYPKSSFAKAFLESGSLSNGTNFRRTLKYITPQMYGMDIMSVQRALMAYGYLDATDVKDEEYGYYGPSTYQAVKDYQTDKGLESDGIVGNNTIKKLFSAGSNNNKSQISFEGLNRINIFKKKHDLVCIALAANVSYEKKGDDIVMEAYIHNAGKNDKGGRADVVRKGPPNRVWEVKPDTPYGRRTGYDQVSKYVLCSHDKINTDKYDYCPLNYGTTITPFNLKWTGMENIYVFSGDDDNNEGVVFYRQTKRAEPVFEPSYEPAFEKNKNEDYAETVYPEPKSVYVGVADAGVNVKGYFIAAGIIALILAIPSGGTSFLLCYS